MKIAGIIAEYNPFHNGHQYQIEKTKELTGADHVIVVMSGNYVQRGCPSIMPKHLRAQAALAGGAALIIELPVCYATASAEQFAYGGVSLLDQLGCVDYLCFGSECGDLKKLQKIADILSEEPADFRASLDLYLKEGCSFPLARQKALSDYLGADSELLARPNNILGIEYLKAIRQRESAMIPVTIQRISSDYHDTALQEDYSSATAIRRELCNSSLGDLGTQVPAECFSLLQNNYLKRYPIVSDDYSLLLKYRLLQETKESLTAYADVSEELANRIINQRNSFQSFDSFCDLLKTKEITYSRISRALLHITLGIKKHCDKDPSYARVLGFRKDSTEVMTKIKEQGRIPLLTKLPSAPSSLMLEQDLFASNLYEAVLSNKFHTSFINEYEHSIVRF